MRSLFVAAAGSLSLLIVHSAGAADMLPPLATKAAPPSLQVLSWTGLYFGANAGYGWGVGSGTNPVFAATPTTGNFAISGPLAGGQVGYNWQFNAFVAGVESDVDWSNATGSTSSGLCAGVVCTNSNSWLGTTRARLGFAVDHWLFYGTGGVAYGDIKLSDAPAAVGVNGSVTNVGWTVGGGVEYAALKNWSVKAEYLFVNLGSVSLACTPACGTTSGSINENIVRGGLDYHF
jgi:outer membrane immunogenic protein